MPSDPLALTPAPIRFGTDGWRGVLGVDFTAERLLRAAAAAAQELAASVAPEVAGQTVLIGYDHRFLAPELAELAAAAVRGCGLTPLLAAAAAPTPALSWAVKEHRALGALVITASHNPPEWLGLKIKGPFAGSVEDAFTARVEQRLLAAGVATPERGATSSFDPWTPYLAGLRQQVDCNRLRQGLEQLGLLVLVDPMHGSAAGGLARLLGEQVTELHGHRDPCFGGRAPEPLEHNLAELSTRVKAEAARGQQVVGLAFDGDGDRIAAIDERGVFCSTQLLMPLLIDHLSSTTTLPGAVVKTVSGSDLMAATASACGRQLREVAVGFKHIASVMQREAVLVGGEESGGVGFGHHIPERDAMLAALLVLEALVAGGQPLGQRLDTLQHRCGLHLHYDRLDLRLQDMAARTRLQNLLDHGLPAEVAGEPVREVLRQDGVKLRIGDTMGHWLMLRFSGTEPLLRLYCEAPSRERLDVVLGWARTLASNV